MPAPILTPRLNNNDDFVRFTRTFVSPGAYVRRGDPVAELETDKASFTVEAETDGYVLGFGSQTGGTIAVGSVLMWIGNTSDEAIPVSDDGEASAPGFSESVTRSPTLKAAILLAQHGLRASEIPGSGERLTSSDVERYINSREQAAKPNRQSPGVERWCASAAPMEPGARIPLTPPARGMLRTVAWQKAEAVPAYLEMSFDQTRWAEYAAEFQQRHHLLLNPLLALLAKRLVHAAIEGPAINATIVEEQRHVYDHVGLGFTIQAADDLVVVVIREAEKLDELDFANRLGDLQRRALSNKLQPSETSGATIGFSSMARWAVTRHVPVLLPQTALMIAHAAPPGEPVRLGATYDHRVLNGAQVVRALQALTCPPEKKGA